jgi:arylsulfatase A-like enzyme
MKIFIQRLIVLVCACALFSLPVMATSSSAQPSVGTRQSGQSTSQSMQPIRATASRLAGGTSARRPNIVFILLDDVRYDDLIDHPFVQLPNLNRVINEGASFQRFFTSAPLCSPSRAVFMTGQYPHRNGIIDNGERAEQSHQLVTFPRLLHETGYQTGFFGKWHMGHDDDTARPGFDRWVSFIGQGVYFDPRLNVDGRNVQAAGYMTDILTDYAISFIEGVPRDQPFLAFVSQKASHPEIHPNQVRTFPPARGDEKLYENATLPHLPSWRAPVSGKPALERPVDVNDPRSPAGGLPDAVIRERLRMLSAVDRSIGRLIESLTSKGILDQTIFIVSSDQGFFYGEFGLAQERRLAYEPSIRIPFIVRYPPLARPNSRPNALLSNVDVAPTLLELAGVPAPANLDGRSMVRAFRGSSRPIRPDFLIEYYTDTEFPRLQNMGYQAIRTDRYKYIQYRTLQGMDELYDLNHDPYELNNLLPHNRSTRLLHSLRQRLNKLIHPKERQVN